jgi:hypothetical protein
MPFANTMERALHFARHGAEFGVADENEYETLADAFMFGALPTDVNECLRPAGIDRLRFKDANRHFGVAVVTSNMVRTFFVVHSRRIARRGGSTGFFSFECSRVNL